ncbi:MAG: hypothetical protein R2731_08740 [Nocardioides sp.]
MPFVQALLARLPPLCRAPATRRSSTSPSSAPSEALYNRADDVMLVTHDGDFLPQLERLCDGRRVGVMAFPEFRNRGFVALADKGVEFFDLETDVKAFLSLPRVKVIPIDEFDPLDYL